MSEAGQSARDIERARRQRARENDIREVIPQRRSDGNSVVRELETDRAVTGAAAHVVISRDHQTSSSRDNSRRNSRHSGDGGDRDRDRADRAASSGSSRALSNNNNDNDDPELMNAASRTTPARRGGGGGGNGQTSRAGSSSRSLATVTPANTLVSTLGYNAGLMIGAETLPPSAASYFRTVTTNAAINIPSSSQQTGGGGGGANGTTIQPPSASLADAITNSIMSGGRPAAIANPPPLPSTAAGAGPYAPVLHPNIYEESIATGKFRRIQNSSSSNNNNNTTTNNSNNNNGTDGNGGAGGGRWGGAFTSSSSSSSSSASSSRAASYLQARLAARRQVEEGDGTPLSADLRQVIQAGCRIAQGLLAGASVAIVVQATRTSTDADFLSFFAALVSSLRFLTWVIATISWLGAVDQIMQAGVVFGKFFPPYNLSSTASVTLAKNMRWLFSSVVWYSFVLACVLYSMPAENRIRAAATAATASGSPNTYFTHSANISTELSEAVLTWRNVTAARTFFVLCAWICVSFSSASPSEVYASIQDATETEVEMANNSNNNNNNSSGKELVNMDSGSSGKGSDMV